MKLTKGDKLLIIFLSIFSLLLAYYISFVSNKSSKYYLSIMVDGEEIRQIELNKENIGKTFEINTKFGRNVLQVGDQTARVIEADCPDKLDVKQGEISKPGQVIVCLPNRLIIEYKSRDESDNDKIDNFNY